MALQPKYTRQLVVTEEPEIDARVRALERMGPVTLAAAHRAVLRLGLRDAEQRFADGDYSEPEIPARVFPETGKRESDAARAEREAIEASARAQRQATDAAALAEALADIERAEREAEHASALASTLAERVRAGDDSVTAEQVAGAKDLGLFARLRVEAAQRRGERAREQARRAQLDGLGAAMVDAYARSAAASAAGGVTSGRPPIHLDVAALVLAYQGGSGLVELAAAHGVGASTVVRRLRAAGVTLRRPGGSTAGARTRIARRSI